MPYMTSTELRDTAKLVEMLADAASVGLATSVHVYDFSIAVYDNADDVLGSIRREAGGDVVFCAEADK